MDQKSIPLITVEEHHEAFYVWSYAARQQLIAPTGNSLLHVDEHSDMSAGRFKHPIYHLNGDLEAVRRYTYAELRIDTFLSAAIVRGLINRICWVKQEHNGSTGKDVEMYIRSFNDDGKKLIIAPMPADEGQQETLESVRAQRFVFSRAHTNEMPAMPDTILDIDLDFFSCAGNPYKQHTLSIEVSKEQYDEYVSNPYHMLNYHFTRISADKKDDRHYFIINDYDEIYLESTYVDEDTIRKRIDLFISELQRKEIVPQLINICRSRHSGYTPADQWEFIENTLVGELDKIYPVKVVPFHTI
ncbi:MAG TPA: UPF0489 family protein [Chitinophaga sp.]|uniref:UPF0489 family protein n=1 Tax=Chitinophaga sp. TaxID=1869181 RepID=UPI002B9A3091|nr:UPF0489 family protein [Chitinophaga sp.]HVI43564.1 UPF0489 family protein [Chitinophaga sp.]